MASVLPFTVNPQQPEAVRVSLPSALLAARATTRSAFTGLLLALGGVAVLIGGVGIANIMVISVLERRHEIGLRRALGATRTHIAAQFITEAVLLSLLGGLTGLRSACAVTAGFAQIRRQPLVMPAWVIVAALGTAAAVGVVAGLYPAMRAARMAPSQALRSG